MSATTNVNPGLAISEHQTGGTFSNEGYKIIQNWLKIGIQYLCFKRATR